MTDTDASSVPAHWKRNVSLFLTGQTVSLFGSMIVQYVVMWYITFETGSGLALALYTIAGFLPQGIISIFGGVLADRMNRRLLVIAADTVTAVATLVLALLMLGGVTDLWVILVAVAIRSVGAGVQTPAVTAIIPQLTPQDQLMRVNGIFQSVQSAMMLLAPVAAGAVYASFGIIPAFFIDVVTAVIGIGMLLLVTVPTLASLADKTTSYRTDLVDGMRYIWQHHIVRWLLILFAIIMVLTMAPSFLTPLGLARTYGEEVWLVTVLEIAFSIGMMIGGVLIATVLVKKSRIALILMACFGFAVLNAALGLSLSVLWLFFAFMFLVGLLVPIISGPYMTLLQETVEPEMHGRVFSYVSIVMALSAPIGMSIFGPVADTISVEALLVISGLITVVVTAVAIAVPSGRAAIAAARTAQAESAQAESAQSESAAATPAPPPSERATD